MLVSHSKKFIYFKTVKTAGSSVEVALQEHCLPPGVETPKACPAYESAYGIVGERSGSAPGEAATWYNHMPAWKIRDQLPAEVWASYRHIANIRNPWDKTVSWFHFLQPQMKEKSTDEILARFRAWLADPETRLGIDTNIYFIEGVPVIDDYICHTTIDADYRAVCDRLGVEAKPLPRLKAGARGRNKIPYQEYFTAEGRARIAEVYKREIETFGWRFDSPEVGRLPTRAG